MVHTVFQTDFLCPADVPLRFVVTVTVTVPSAQTGSPLSNLEKLLDHRTMGPGSNTSMTSY